MRKSRLCRNVSQFKSFLGLVNYYSKFLTDLSTILAPLYKLMQKETEWKGAKKAFEDMKDLLTSDCLLVHFNPDQKLVLVCDASPYGVGADTHPFESNQAMEIKRPSHVQSGRPVVAWRTPEES